MSERKELIQAIAELCRIRAGIRQGVGDKHGHMVLMEMASEIATIATLPPLPAPASTSAAPSGGERCETCGGTRVHEYHDRYAGTGHYHSFRPAKEDHDD